MFTALSKTYELDVNFDFEDFPGLPFFLMCFTWALTFAHPRRTEPLEWFCCVWAGEPFAHHQFLLSLSSPP